MKRLALALLLIPTLSSAATVCFTPPTQREDGVKLSTSEIANYRLHRGDTKGSYTTNELVPGGSNTCYTFTNNLDTFGAMKTLDTEGRESKFSNEVLIPGLASLRPATITDFTVTQVGETYDYVMTWTKPVEFNNGTSLPVDSITKYTIFDDQATLTDTTSTTITLPLTISDHNLTVQTEILVDGTYTVSYDSNVVSVTIGKIVSPPNPVTNIKVTRIPGTYDYVFEWDLPTHYENGNVLPIDNITKLFIFDNGKWLQDVNRPTLTSVTRTLGIGDHLVDFEIEVLTGKVSKRSLMIAVTVEEITIAPPNAPTITVQ